MEAIYICGQCGKSETGERKPIGWCVPFTGTAYQNQQQSPPARGTVIALCSEKCLANYNRQSE